MKKGTALYFGTSSKGSGHHAELLNGAFDNRKERSEIEVWLDNLSERDDLRGYWPTRGTFATIQFERGTWFGVNLSPHDERDGSKTVLYVEGLHLSEQQMVALLHTYPYALRMFQTVCKKYELTLPPMVLSGADEITKERKRQIEAEGYDSGHNAEHEADEFTNAAVSYLLCSMGFTEEGIHYWPWSHENWKPKDKMRNLVRAGALIAAAIDRLKAEE